MPIEGRGTRFSWTMLIVTLWLTWDMRYANLRWLAHFVRFAQVTWLAAIVRYSSPGCTRCTLSDPLLTNGSLPSYGTLTIEALASFIRFPAHLWAHLPNTALDRDNQFGYHSTAL